METTRPSWGDLTPEQQLKFGNGIGPSWFTENQRAFITKTCSWFFQEACWRHHDFGYCVGHREVDRWKCDWKFFGAMVRDSLSHDGWKYVNVPGALTISVAFFIAVRAGGWYKSFVYGKRYATIDEVMAEF